MRSLLAVACVILALDLSIVVVQVSGPAVPPTIEEDNLAEGAETSAGAALRPAVDSDPLPRHLPSSAGAASEQTATSPPTKKQVPQSNDEPPSTQEPSTSPGVSISEHPNTGKDSPSPTPVSSPTPTESKHGESSSEDGGEVTVQIVFPKTRFAVGESVPFTLHMCNETTEDIMWGYPEHQERPVEFGFTTNTEEPSSAALRNGDEGHTQGAVTYLELPAHDCVSWGGRWEQTLGLFDLDGTSSGEPFPSGEVQATLTADGGVDGRNIRHPEHYVTVFIG